MQIKTTTETAGRASAIGTISRRAFFAGAGAVALPVSAVARPAKLSLHERYKSSLDALIAVLNEMHPGLDRHECFISRGEEPGSGYMLLINGSRLEPRHNGDVCSTAARSEFAEFDALHNEYLAVYATWISMDDGDDGEEELGNRVTDVEQRLIAFPCESVGVWHRKRDVILNNPVLLDQISYHQPSLKIYLNSLAPLDGGAV